MGMVQNFQQRDVAEAIELLLHMITVLREHERPSQDDITRVRELIDKIKSSR